MGISQQKTFGEKLNTWVQTIGIILAAAWGIYTFTYKEIIIPQSSPINITLNLNLKKSDIIKSEIKGKKAFKAIEMKINAKNPSRRTIYLLPNAFIAYGYKNYDYHYNDEQFLQMVSRTTISSELGSPICFEKHTFEMESSILACGSIFDDDVLKPDEEITRTMVFFIPQGEYDEIQVHAVIPSVNTNNIIICEWNMDINKKIYIPTFFHLNKDGNKIKLEVDKQGNILDKKLIERYELQSCHTRSEISLW